MRKNSHSSAKQAQREAAPSTFANGDLTAEQRQAAVQVLELTQSLVENSKSNDPSPRSKWDAVLPVLHQQKFNQVVLIDGKRGSGKTTVLLTLLDLWIQHHRGNDTGVRRIVDGNTDYIKLLKPAIPLGLLHLGALPGSGNLLVHVASLFRPMLNLLEDNDGRPCYQPAREGLKARKLWTEFMRVAATAWDDHLSVRRRDMDADSYAIELEETEVRRLHIRQSFFDFIGALREDSSLLFKQEGFPETPLWIIPIDDADINPHCTVQLLDLLRILWHPQIMFLLTGDSELFQQMLKGHILGSIARPLRQLPSNGKSIDIVSYAKWARRLTDDIYLKLIPRDHRCLIRELDLSERLERMEGELVKLKFPLDPSRNQSDAISEPLGNIFRTIPQSRHALPSRMRTVVALSAEIKRLLAPESANGSEALWSYIDNRWKYYVDSSDEKEEEKATLRGLITKSRDGEPTVNHRGKVHIWPTRAILADGSIIRGKPSVMMREYTGFGASYASDRKHPLPEEIVATLLIAMSAFPFSSNYNIPLGRLCTESINAAYVQIGHAANSVGLDGTQQLWLGWPIPDWESPYLWLTFSERWRKRVDFLKTLPSQPSIGDLALHYLNVALSVIIYDDTVPMSIDSFPSIIGQILSAVEHQQERRGRSPRHRASYEWAVQVLALLAVPESGLPHEFANQIAECIHEHLNKKYSIERRKQIFDELEEKRRLRIRIMLENSSYTNGDIDKSLSTFINHYDGVKYKHFEWKKHLKPRTGKPRRASVRAK